MREALPQRYISSITGLRSLPRLLRKYSTCLLYLLTLRSCGAGFRWVDQEKNLSDTSEAEMPFTDHFVPSAQGLAS